MNIIKSLILPFCLMAGICCPMKQAHIPCVEATHGVTDLSSTLPHTVDQAGDASFPAYFPELPRDLKLVVLIQVVAPETMSSLLFRLGALRRVSKGWQAFLHEPVIIEQVLRVKYPEVLRGTSLGFCLLRELVGTLVSQKSHTAEERGFLRVLRDDTDEFMQTVLNILLDTSSGTVFSDAAELRKAVLALRKDPKGYYALLLIQPTASQKEIRSAYRRLMLMTHPDKNSLATAHSDATDINTAYEILNNPDTRKIYHQ